MTAPDRSARGPGARAGLSIGAVLTALRTDFPDVTISKIRFLESEGLVTPDRTPSGYRQFSAVDCERLRYVLAAQRDHYLPLKVIKEQLDALGRGEAPGLPGPPPPRVLSAAPVVAPEHFAEARPVRITREQLVSESGGPEQLVADLIEHGVLRSGEAGFFDADAVALVRTAAQMAEHGVHPRHLRAFRSAADREAGLIAQIARPVAQQRDDAAQARAQELVRELAALSVTLHAVLVKAALAQPPR